MPDPIPGLDRMASEAGEVHMLPPSEIRRLGNRRRRTRNVVGAGLVVALIAVAGFGLTQSGLLNAVNPPNVVASPSPSDPESQAPTESESPSESESETPEPTDTETPETSETPPATETDDPSASDSGNPPVATVKPPTWDNAPTPEMFEQPSQPDYVLEVKNQYEGMGQAAKGLCDQGYYGDPTTHLTREIGSKGDYMPHIDATVFGYKSAEDATAGFEKIRDAALNCAEQMNNSVELEDAKVHDQTSEVPFDAGSVDAEPVKMAYVSYAALISDSEEGMFGDTLVVQAGERVLWITSTIRGMDKNCTPADGDENEMQCELPAALPKAVEALLKNR